MTLLRLTPPLLFLFIASTSFTSRAMGLDQCLALASQNAADTATLGQLRRQCAQRIEAAQSANNHDDPSPSENGGVVEQRAALEELSQDNPFVLTPHRANYLLPISWRDSTYDYNSLAPGADEPIDNTEVEFQISVKVDIARGILGDGILSAAYTNRSYWQAYNKAISAPFRETNHEPELILSYRNDWQWRGLRNVGNQLIFNHQSNGRSDPISRSWNRIMLNMIFEYEQFAMAFKPWYRIPEAAEDDDNRDIEFSLGHFEWMGFYHWQNQTLSVMLRNNLRSDNRGAVEVGWSFPISARIKAYVKYFDGYGESLIEHNNSLRSIGLGVLISDWL